MKMNIALVPSSTLRVLTTMAGLAAGFEFADFFIVCFKFSAYSSIKGKEDVYIEGIIVNTTKYNCV